MSDFSTKSDGGNVAIIELRAGAGGNEAGLFCAELAKAYGKFALSRGWRVVTLARSEGDIGNVREISIEVSGINPNEPVFELLKKESGVHRVQRIPRTEKSGRIHTSTVTVAVLPPNSPVELKIDPKDIKFEAFRSGGHGGQNVNKVSTAVRLTHLPTGVTVACQEERSQFQNRAKAESLLKSKLYQIMLEQKKESLDELRRDQVGSGERNEKIKTYNFPQDRLTDHRSNRSYYNLKKILDGSLLEILKG